MHERNDFTSPENFVPLERHLLSASTKKKERKRQKKETGNKDKKRKADRDREKERQRVCARKVVEGGVLRRNGGTGSKKRKYSLPPPRIRPPFSTPCEDEDTSRLLPDTSVRIQHLLPPSSSERLHGVCSDWAGDFSPCDERRGMSLRFEVISLFLEWSCLSATWIYYRNCFALVNWSHGFHGVEYRVFLLDEVIRKKCLKA